MISVTNPKPHGCEHLLPFPAEKVVSKRWGFQQHGGAFTLQTLMGGPIEWCLVVVLHIFYLRGETEVVYPLTCWEGKSPPGTQKEKGVGRWPGSPRSCLPPRPASCFLEWGGDMSREMTSEQQASEPQPEGQGRSPCCHMPSWCV